MVAPRPPTLSEPPFLERFSQRPGMMRSRLWNRQPISSPDHTHYLLRRNPFVQIGPLDSLGLGTELDKRWLISNEGTKTLTGFFATFYARGIFGNSALPKLALVLSANFGDLLRLVHPHLFRHQMITYLTWDLSDT